MACESFNKSRKLGCKTRIKAGIKRVGFLPFVESATESGLTVGAQNIWDGVGLTGSVYVYSLKNDGNSYTDTLAADSNTRNVLFNGELTLTLPGLDADTHEQIMLLAVSNPHIFLELNSGKTLLVGAVNGAELTGGTFVTGGAATDMQGYTLTFTSQEGSLASLVGATGSTMYKNAIDMTGAIDPS
jgi:hypothetical protein